ncbi:hypothetical protein PsYK624_138220 [Phanerochaete sordida]|uniref:Uncharacterized protein n=1 Tax=Phanerochaete sordida TaxID=48140 RepID=A0A9P3LJJ6_9APHY|nr:hypothetical protein PsYK624_138220 [Phanerochaete sordida]
MVVQSEIEVLKITPQGWLQLVQPSANTDEVEEITLSAQGYITSVNLPPIYHRKQLRKNINHSSQSVVITGLGADVFDKYMEALISIHHVLGLYLPHDALLPLKTEEERGDLAIYSHNRYYTLQENIQEAIIDFDKTIDPNDVLRANKPVNAEYTEDNKVEYFEQHTDISKDKDLIQARLSTMKEEAVKRKHTKRKVVYRNLITETEYRLKKLKLDETTASTEDKEEGSKEAQKEGEGSQPMEVS